MFDTSTMTPPSAFHPTPTMHCYRPTMSSMDPRFHLTATKKKTMMMKVHLCLDVRQDNKENLHVVQDLIDSSLIFKLLNYVIFKLNYHINVFLLNVKL